MNRELLELKIRLRFLMTLLKMSKRKSMIQSIRDMNYKELNLYLKETHGLLKYRIPEVCDLYAYAYNRKVMLKREYALSYLPEPSFYRVS